MAYTPNNSKPYIGTKIIKAQPMSKNSWIRQSGKELPMDADDKREGYLVEYPDGYKSWSPKDVFENAYREITESEFKLLEE